MASESPRKGCLSKDDCTCPICLEILVEPVTMPCKHSLCMPCYRQTVEKASLTCPICRCRISTWARRASRHGNLIDKKKWEAVKKSFPGKVQDRLEGRENSDEDENDILNDIRTQMRKLKELSKPGEIGKEYEEAMRKLEQQREEERRKEEEASAALIRTLQEQEELEMEELYSQREVLEMIDRKTAEELDETSRLNNLGASSVPITKQQQQQKKEQKKTGVSNSQKDKQKAKGANASLTLNSFFSPVRRTSTSAPPNLGKNNERQQPNYSPYPYACISPKDKIFYGLSYLDEESKGSSESSSDVSYGGDHGYSTASAKKIDLTKSKSDEVCVPRTDIETYDLSKVKAEPIDIFAPGPSGMDACSSSSSQHHFAPICSSPKTPPKKLPGGSVHDPVLIKSTVRHLLVTDFDKEIVHPAPTPSPKKKHAVKVSSPTVGEIKAKTSKVSADKRCLLKGQNGAKKLVIVNGGFKKIVENTSQSSSESKSGKGTFDDKGGGEREECVADNSHVGKSTNPLRDKKNSNNNKIIKTINSNSRTGENEIAVKQSNEGKSSKEKSGTLLSFFKNHVGNSESQLYETSVSPRKSRHQVSRKDHRDAATEWDGKKTEDNVMDSMDCTDISNDSSSSSVVSVLLVENDENKAATAADYRLNASGDSQDKRVLDESTYRQVNTETQRTTNSPKAKGGVSKAAGRKRRLSSDSEVEIVESLSVSLSKDDPAESKMTQEEKDFQIALELQNLYSMLDKKHIKVDRFKGSDGEYSLRHPPKRTKRK